MVDRTSFIAILLRGLAAHHGQAAGAAGTCGMSRIAYVKNEGSKWCSARVLRLCSKPCWSTFGAHRTKV